MQQQDKEQLGDFLREMFNDYEAEPLDSSWEKIRQGIVPPPSQKPSLGWKPWLAGLIVLISLIGTYTATQSHGYRSVSQNFKKKNEIKTHSQATNLSNQEIAGNGTTLSRENRLNTNAKSEGITTDLGSSTPVIFAKKQENRTIALKKEKIQKGQQPQETAPSLTTTLMNNVAQNRRETNGILPDLTASITENTILSVDNVLPVQITENRKIEEVNALLGKPSSKFLVSLNPILPQFKPTTIDFKKKTYPLEIIFSATPFFTYQRQHAILQASGKEIQNIQTHESFSRNRAGLNLNLALSRQLSDRSNLRIGLSYTYMSQWAEYEIAQDAFTVRRSAARLQDNIVRDGVAVKEFNRINLVGISLNRQYFLNSVGKVRYFVSTGAEGMLNPTNGNQHLFVNGSVGISYHLPDNQSLTIEPVVSYDLGGSQDGMGLLKINPYNLGVKVGLGFGIKK